MIVKGKGWKTYLEFCDSNCSYTFEKSTSCLSLFGLYLWTVYNQQANRNICTYNFYIGHKIIGILLLQLHRKFAKQKTKKKS